MYLHLPPGFTRLALVSGLLLTLSMGIAHAAGCQAAVADRIKAAHQPAWLDRCTSAVQTLRGIPARKAEFEKIVASRNAICERVNKYVHIYQSDDATAEQKEGALKLYNRFKQRCDDSDELIKAFRVQYHTDASAAVETIAFLRMRTEMLTYASVAAVQMGNYEQAQTDYWYAAIKLRDLDLLNAAIENTMAPVTFCREGFIKEFRNECFVNFVLAMNVAKVNPWPAGMRRITAFLTPEMIRNVVTAREAAEKVLNGYGADSARGQLVHADLAVNACVKSVLNNSSVPKLAKRGAIDPLVLPQTVDQREAHLKALYEAKVEDRIRQITDFLLGGGYIKHSYEDIIFGRIADDDRAGKELIIWDMMDYDTKTRVRSLCRSELDARSDISTRVREQNRQACSDAGFPKCRLK